MNIAESLFDEAPDEETGETNLDGHTADRTEMPPWESCGPDCPVCAESEK